MIIIDIFFLRADDDADVIATSVAVKSVETLLEISLFMIGRDFDCAKFSDIKIRLSRTYVVFWVNLFSVNLCRGSEITSLFIADKFPSSAERLLKEVLFSLR